MPIYWGYTTFSDTLKSWSNGCSSSSRTRRSCWNLFKFVFFFGKVFSSGTSFSTGTIASSGTSAATVSSEHPPHDPIETVITFAVLTNDLLLGSAVPVRSGCITIVVGFILISQQTWGCITMVTSIKVTSTTPSSMTCWQMRASCFKGLSWVKWPMLINFEVFDALCHPFLKSHEGCLIPGFTTCPKPFQSQEWNIPNVNPNNKSI